MTKKNLVFLSFAAAAATIALILVTKATKHSKRLNNIADEGYETAADILYPETGTRRRKVHYGPVVPADENFEILN
ncbi:MAG: hypothetical protein ABIP68_00675 [Ferruginibacter sp.]